ncbi:unnamed protein product [Zymoseptoria tritici ST99CH_1A5]|uniref:Peptidase M3A/M3B catalytic domain-containing protein n=1 Tax=Zymoseptoria tritici ST99CH_1A5 TaxID=1276529 RepID=A0A1Y6LSI5_ZYMTR|nr:unnamed protein product [Zymoseptoria tritici ST99CH_1A5]
MPDLLETTHGAITQTRSAIHQIIHQVPPSTATFTTILLPLSHAENTLAQKTHLLIFHASAHPDPTIRQTSTQARALLDVFAIEVALNEPLFTLINAVVHKAEELAPEDARLLGTKYRTSIRHGMLLPDSSSRDRLRELRGQVGEATVAFQANLVNANGGVWYSRSALNGVPERVLDSLEVGTTGLVKVTFCNAHLAAVLRYAKSADVRRNFFIAFENSLPENRALFRTVVLLRDEVARLLGYASHASLVLPDRMAGSPEVVEAFLEELRVRLTKTSVLEAEKIRALKAKDLGLDGKEEEEMGYWLWDQPYYHRMMLETEYQVDQERISEWFPLRVVVERMLGIFEEIFGLKFEAVDEANEEPSDRPPIWHEDVQVFAVQDADDDGAFLGWLYMDLYDRPGKKGGNGCNYNLVPVSPSPPHHCRRPLTQPHGFTRPNGTWQHPSTALLCNFPTPTPSTPTLLHHSEVVTLFHELGHAIHDLVSKTFYACFHGTAVPVDFGEAPSQMLEEWCWTPAILKSLSCHYATLSPSYFTSWQAPTTPGAEQPQETLPDSMITSLIAARNVNAAHFYLNQLRHCIFDMAVHHPSSHEALQAMDLATLYNELRSKILPPRGPETQGESLDWGHGYVWNGHVMQEDYSAGYYSYIFSKVLAADMFESTFRQDPMSRWEGRRYRYTILQPGGSRDAMEMVREFLGREPGSGAFDLRICSNTEL